MKHASTRKLPTAIVPILICSILYGVNVRAQTDEPETEARRKPFTQIEEVVVTARRREESLQDTPIAVSALNAEDLRDRGITNTVELTKSVPSLQMTDGQSNHIYIRGVGERTGFVRVDSAVGVYLDDLFIPQQDSMLLDTIDIQQIQVLRGPQGTLFGKNTTGGAIVLTPVKPGEAFEGYVEGAAGNYGLTRARAAVNIPMSDRFFVRLSANTVNDDGYTKDIGTGDRNDARDRQAALLQTRWDTTDAVTLDALLYHGRIRDRFAGINCRMYNEDTLFVRGLYLMHPGDTDPQNPTAWVENCQANDPDRLPDLRTNFGSTNNNYDKDITNTMLGATLNWAFSDSHSIKAVVGAQAGEREPFQNFDSDGGPEMFLHSLTPRVSDRQSVSLELQLNGSAVATRFNYTAGVFLMKDESEEAISSVTSIIGFDGETLADLASGEFPDQPSSPAGTTPFVGPLGPVTIQQFDLDSTTLAAFFQGSYDLSENLQVTLGMRYTEERRVFDLNTFSSDADAIANRIQGTHLGPFGPVTFGPPVGGLHPCSCSWAQDPVSVAAALFPDTDGDGTQDYPMDFDNPSFEKRDETFSKFTPMFSTSYNLPEGWLQGTVMDSMMVYATWSNGFKSGFFEPRGADGLQRVEQETLENREVGIKIDAFQRSLRFNAALYQMIFEDMQLIVVSADSDGSTTVNFNNAGESKIEGVELEMSWVPLPGLMINLSYSHNDYEFIEYEEADLLTLVVKQREDLVDRSDEPFPVSPEETFSFGIQYLWDTALGIIVPRVDVSHKSEIFLGFDRGSFEAYQRDKDLAGADAFTLVDARIGWTNREENLSAALFVENLTDKRYIEGGTSVADTIGSFNIFNGAPRRYGLELRYLF